MQSVSWYLHRLQAMSFAEVWWRAVGAGRDSVDALRFRLGSVPADPGLAATAVRLADPATPKLCDVARGEWREAPSGSPEYAWRVRLIAQADAIERHHIGIFGRTVDLGNPIDWNRDHIRGQPTPVTF